MKGGKWLWRGGVVMGGVRSWEEARRRCHGGCGCGQEERRGEGVWEEGGVLWRRVGGGSEVRCGVWEGGFGFYGGFGRRVGFFWFVFGGLCGFGRRERGRAWIWRRREGLREGERRCYGRGGVWRRGREECLCVDEDEEEEGCWERKRGGCLCVFVGEGGVFMGGGGGEEVW